MKKASYTIIGNWKMYFTFKQALNWLRSAKSELDQVCQKSGNSLILCPSFESLYSINLELKDSQIELGAQDCSNYLQGAYTGQISARSLSEIGCSYCIVGHSERRAYQREQNEEIAQKVKLLLESTISPILCIGESKQEYEAGKTEEILKNQLKPITESLPSQSSKIPFYIAYEPIWAIGTGVTPENSYLEKIFTLIKTITKQWPNKDSIHLLYGGSVNAQTCESLKNISTIEGFLIGKASTDFQELKKIVSLL